MRNNECLQFIHHRQASGATYLKTLALLAPFFPWSLTLDPDHHPLLSTLTALRSTSQAVSKQEQQEFNVDPRA